MELILTLLWIVLTIKVTWIYVDLRNRQSKQEKDLFVLRMAAGHIWRTGRGDLIFVKDMTDTHISNCMEYLNTCRMTRKDHEWMEIFRDEQKRRRRNKRMEQ